MAWKVGNFHQIATKTNVYAFKVPTEKDFVTDFVDLHNNVISLVIKDAPRCTDKPFFCKNGAVCKDGICKCQSGFTGIQCESGEIKGGWSLYR